MKQPSAKKKKQIQKIKSQYQQKNIIAEAVGVHKRYVQEAVSVDALQNIDVVIREGEIVAIVGPSGCGKTTLLNCLASIDDIDRGDVYFSERNFAKMSDREKTLMRGKEMGFIFQSFNLIPVLSAVENVELPMLAIGGNAKEARERALALLEEVGLTAKAKHKPGELSGGEKQRVAIARALINNPKIVWGDEPTGNLDTKNAEAIIELMQSINKSKGTTFVIVTHDLNIAMKATRIIRMDSGKIV